MAKEALKKRTSDWQNGECELSGEQLPEDPKLFDTDRKRPKVDGGTYTDDNTRAVVPIAHMKRHGTLRERTAAHDKLKATVDDRRQVMRLRQKIENQLLAYKRWTDVPTLSVVRFLEQQLDVVSAELGARNKAILKLMKKLALADPLVGAALKVRAVGPMTVAHAIVYIDLTKARHASSLWSYAGLDKASSDRYTKGEAGGGNKTLRCALWNMAKSQVKLNGPYRVVYDNTKHRLSHSDVIVKSRNTQGKPIECAWKDTKPCHREGAAIRVIMKHFLADYWYVGRTLLGLETTPGYAEAHLGGTHKTIMPEERGWEY